MTALENGPGSALPTPEDLHDAARSEAAVAEQINGYAETLDEVIATIRTSIVGLHLRFNLF
jgi:hypothetical protein